MQATETKRQPDMKISALARELLQYLKRNPDACDTLAGIAGWWIRQQHIEVLTIDVKDALDELITLELVLKRESTFGEPHYSLNPKNLTLVTSLCSNQPPKS